MSKEQIAEIKNKFHSFLNQSERSTIAISQNHLNLLIEQAETYQKCNVAYDELTHEFNLLKEQNKRYRETLQFYADRKSYQAKVENPEWGAATAILVDRGYKARKELRDES